MKPTVPARAGDAEALRRAGPHLGVGRRELAVARLDTLLDPVAGSELAGLEVLVGGRRHHLDEAHGERSLERQVDEPVDVLRLVIVHEDRIELDRIEARGERRLDSLPYLLQVVASRDLVKALAVQRVDAHVDAVDPGIQQGRRQPRQLGAVRRQGEVVEPRQRAQPAHDFENVLADERLATGDPHLPDAEVDQGPYEALDALGVEEVAVTVRKLGVLGQAVEATEIAPIGHRDPEVGQPASEGVDES